MKLTRRLLLASAATCATLACAATPSPAVVGGNDASPGAYPSVAEVTLGPGFLCTGTLIAPTWVLTAGHCGSITGAAVATPVAWPAPLIDVRIGSVTPGEGEQVAVLRAIVSPVYLVTDGFDVTLLELAEPSTKAPTPVAGPNQRSIWAAGSPARIVGFGTTAEDGDRAETLQEAQVPIVSDAGCAEVYDNFDPSTMVCAGYPAGGVDTCQGDSGGPLFGGTSGGALRVVGATSFGEGCAREGFPGVYARVADAPLRGWIASQAPAGVNNGSAAATGGGGAGAGAGAGSAADGTVIGAGAYDSAPPAKAKKKKASKKKKKAKCKRKSKRTRRARR